MINTDGSQNIKKYIAGFKYALTEDKDMCLCGIFGAVACGLFYFYLISNI